ncbi:hydantoinase/carbamoylase family amidase [Verminephrobacter aporrectodeae subsp. tuberculatae]|uniref:hydantoinase/carbamoylase family amidase n=2 Tax=Verminephrobacter aporrectodeae TaxID=1110389 RepID=UPI002238893F|nr:hydantoinase/carbamoylase family amidase [Verminephrobacter aporrectodeae]MCW5219685.1 hydantoinase/carbamoylase family amidase [Verminephrobacter aporrectodeae subsp. tuberculatae]MCW5287617.1 hydantoinase/carbamoylase family amidase [Verminephrobacter aporrectodeae subsp. tuberculatae]
MTPTPPTLERLNGASAADALRLLDGLYAHAPWVAERALALRPLRSLAQLRHALVQAVRGAGADAQLALIRANPWRMDQALAQRSPTPDESARIARLDTAYEERFGFPFVLAVRGPRGTGLTQQEIIDTLERRLENHADFERAEALRNLHRIAELRLNDRFGAEPTLGNDLWDWHEKLAEYSDPGFAQQGQLTVTYLTDAHRACARRIGDWMRDCGFDEVATDAVGNVVGRYHPAADGARYLLTGSHYDTVRNGGRYDGRLGIFVPMACVRELQRAGRRLPLGIEVVAFAEEEGQRYPASFLGSGALTGDFDPAWLDQRDAEGISMRSAMQHAGLCVEAIAALRRDPQRYLGFVEVHIEQGPVLNELDLPLGVVSSINGCVRFIGEMIGMASHAGTTPMGRRRDAAAGVAELALYIEQRAAQDEGSVGTIGLLDVPGGSINVVPGRCRFSLDLRGPSDAQRDALVQDVRAQLGRIAARRGLRYTLDEALRAAAAPSAPAWQRHWERAVEALGLPVLRLPSGAGHDAMKLHAILPQAMLFVRGQNAGISHNPLESTTNNDIQLAVDAFAGLLQQLAGEAQP